VLSVVIPADLDDFVAGDDNRLHTSKGRPGNSKGVGIRPGQRYVDFDHRIIRHSVLANKKGAPEIKAAPRTRPRGMSEQHLVPDAPFGALGPSTASLIQGSEDPGWSFSGKQNLTLTRRSNCSHRGDSGTAAIGFGLAPEN
jgi:hypothetical protein